MAENIAHAPWSRNAKLYALIGVLPLADFLQTSVAAFSAAPVMGDISAGPEEYSLVAIVYAVVSLAVISTNRWMVERCGWRTLMLLSAAAMGGGALLCSLAHTLAMFGLGRGIMAIGCGAFMTSGRLFVERVKPASTKFTGIKFYAAGIALGLMLGPLLVAFGLALENWRLPFQLIALLSVAIAILSIDVLDDDSIRDASDRSQFHPLAFIALISGSFFILYSLQQAAFDYFDRSRTLWLGIAFGVVGLLLFASLLMIGRRRPLIHFSDLRQSRYLVGLVMFSIAYLVLGANNYMLPALLQLAFRLPLEIAVLFISFGALGGILSWFVVFRFIKKSKGPKRYYIAGFCALLLGAAQFASLSESANPWVSAAPALVAIGAFVILVLPATALQTFQDVQRNERMFSHAIQVKNMLGQFGIAAGTAIAALCLQIRSAARYNQLGARLAPANTSVHDTLDQLTKFFSAHGDPAHASELALAQLSQIVAQEAAFTAVLDYFVILSGFAITGIVGVLLFHAWKARANTVRS